MSERVKSLADGVLNGERRSLAKAITLVESTVDQDREDAQLILRRLLSQLKARGTPPSLRLGISGPPGAGKSTFIESLGMKLCQQGQRVAVIAIDPSSHVSGGSILGDKTRMTQLSRHHNAFVRPSPTAGDLGGLAARSFEVMLLCEAAGYDTVLIETVGVGQSEVEIEHMADITALLVPPAGGDELQGIKRGIVEIADLVVVNKADGELIPFARRTMRQMRQALHLQAPKYEDWTVPIMTCSAQSDERVDLVFQHVHKFKDFLHERGYFDANRRQRNKKWMWKVLRQELLLRLSRYSSDALSTLEKDVAEGEVAPRHAAMVILDEFIASYNNTNNNNTNNNNK